MTETLKRRRAGRMRPLHAESVMEIVYRFGGVTVSQCARLLALTVPEVEERDDRARRRIIAGNRKSSSPMPSYQTARTVLLELLRSGEVERIMLHRTWDGRERTRIGKTEDLYRFSKSPAGREAVLEAGFTAGGKEEREEAGYRLHWSGGSKDDGAYRHAAHRTDWILAVVESLEDEDLNRFGAYVSAPDVWGESHPDLPLIGARIEKRNAAGQLKYDVKKQKKSNYVAHREFERVVPDFVLDIEFWVAPDSGYQDPPDHDTETRDDGGGWMDVKRTAREEVYS